VTITARQIDLVRQSAAAVDHVVEPFAATFCDRLFREHPAVRPMFPTDPEVQVGKLAAEPAHYPAVGAVLLATVVDQLGDAFTPELHDAWAAAYDTIAASMIEDQEAAALEMAS
jgi:hemoglobin-like flavoprotein